MLVFLIFIFLFFIETYNLWLTLLKDKNLVQYKNVIEKRFYEAMTPFHIMAFATDVQFVDQVLMPSEDKRMTEWIVAEKPEFSNGMASFLIKDEEVFGSLFSLNLPAHKWWRLAKKKFIAQKAAENVSDSDTKKKITI